MGDETGAAEAQHRLEWIREKQRRLDDECEMVHDMPSWHGGRILDYGSLHNDARCRLTQDQIASNEELMRQDAVAAAADATRAAAPAAPAASTAPNGSSSAATAAGAGSSGAEVSMTRPKPSRSKPSGPPPETPGQAAALSSDHPPQAATVQSAGACKRSNDTPEDGGMPKSKARPTSTASAATGKGGDAARRQNDTPEDGATSQAKARPPTATRLPYVEPTPPSYPPPTMATQDVELADKAERDRQVHVEAVRDRIAYAPWRYRGNAYHRLHFARSSND